MCSISLYRHRVCELWITHGLRTPNEGINFKNLKIWADVADKTCFGRTFGSGFSAIQGKQFPLWAPVVREITHVILLQSQKTDKRKVVISIFLSPFNLIIRIMHKLCCTINFFHSCTYIYQYKNEKWGFLCKGQKKIGVHLVIWWAFSVQP